MTTDIPRRAEPPLPAVPWIPPSVRRAWRAVGRMQLGTDPERAAVLTDVDDAVARFIGELDGTRSLREHRAGPTLRGEHVDRVLRLLAESGCLIDLTSAAPVRPRRADPVMVPAHGAAVPGSALVAELAGRSLGRDGTPPLETAARRSRAGVQIVGGRVVPALLSRVLAAAGIGRVIRQTRGVVAAIDIACGDAPSGSLGQDRGTAWRTEMARSHPQLRTDPLGSLEQPDLVILCDPWPGRDEREQTLQRIGTPYLCATVRERRAIVGPLVVPGRSSCLRCQHLHRVDADPGWAAIDIQLRSTEVTAGQAGEIVCATLAAAVAGAQALQWLDGEQEPETVDATLDIALPDLVLNRRHWPVHPDCPCSERAGLGHLTLVRPRAFGTGDPREGQ